MEYISLNIPAMELTFESRGQELTYDLRLIPQTLFPQLIAHAIKQKDGDAASGAMAAAWRDLKGEDAPLPNKAQRAEFLKPGGPGLAKTLEHAAAMREKCRAALYAGQWQVRQGSGTATQRNDVEQEILGLAKAELVKKFKAACAAKGLKGTMEFYPALGEQVAKFFLVNGDKAPTWNDDEVLGYADRQDAKLGEDRIDEAFRTRAEIMVAAKNAGTGAEEVAETVEDILGDL